MGQTATKLAGGAGSADIRISSFRGRTRSQRTGSGSSRSVVHAEPAE
jgi:hypothetical protein